MKNPKMFSNQNKSKGSSKLSSGASNKRTPYTGALESTNSSKRKVSTDIRPQSK
jgi:hypothetical protein|tara:strand:+ start:690 stop:851 length:162 start_codon:yes stop_codon:yes gene_type:complete